MSFVRYNNHRTNEWILFVCARATDGERGLKYGGVATGHMF